jgi:predicted  nucleic acid-binding Zn-ribbon protein
MAEAGLKDIHDLHRRLRDVQQQLERGPRQVEKRRQTVEKRQGEVQVAQERLKDLRHSASKKNGDLKVLETKLADLRTKLNAASTNTEYDVFRRQIDADTAAKEVLEMEILETLERIDQQQAAVKDAEQAVALAVAEEARVRQDVAAAAPGLKEQEAALEARLRQAESIVPAKIMDQYRRVVQAHGADALAAVENKTCTNCFTQLSPQQAVEVNSGQFIFCRSCGRLLYQA